ncbi:mCG145723, isoform CRA_b [Mus musculus]|nr:mCG145723, isoform CRA_b [Mus musculus]
MCCGKILLKTHNLTVAVAVRLSLMIFGTGFDLSEMVHVALTLSGKEKRNKIFCISSNSTTNHEAFPEAILSTPAFLAHNTPTEEICSPFQIYCPCVNSLSGMLLSLLRVVSASQGTTSV